MIHNCTKCKRPLPALRGASIPPGVPFECRKCFGLTAEAKQSKTLMQAWIETSRTRKAGKR